jgi:hypothetical protein
MRSSPELLALLHCLPQPILDRLPMPERPADAVHLAVAFVAERDQVRFVVRAAQMARHKVVIVKVVNALTRNAKIETHGIIFQMKIQTKYIGETAHRGLNVYAGFRAVESRGFSV